MERINLNIQLLADGGLTSLDTTALMENANEIINKIGPHIEELATEIISGVNSLVNSEEFKTITSDTIQSAVALISPYMSGFQEELSVLGNFVIKVVNSYELSDEKLRGEFEAWGTQIKSSIEGIKSSATQPPSGDYGVGDYLVDMSTTAREGVKLGTKAITDTFKLTSNLTGMSVVDTLSKVSESAVGSFGTLLSGAAETAGRFITALTGGIA